MSNQLNLIGYMVKLQYSSLLLMLRCKVLVLVLDGNDGGKCFAYVVGEDVRMSGRIGRILP